ncbi:MAG: hypothetical protein QOG87_3472 [Actinomycetota bacterium]|jgi:hypothetical protein
MKPAPPVIRTEAMGTRCYTPHRGAVVTRREPRRHKILPQFDGAASTIQATTGPAGAACQTL